ncbi:hypothetical protein [Agathobaculum sp.]|uniref:hypothetical protein n=1 Tax=Agathobaculum sp. TaxID=2048138 RepID=UPI002A80C868|nr:hypothetical protein [Agathobaculum sp.]MDY3618457.1 hypothetical protein [Agathobaculum sp.]
MIERLIVIGIIIVLIGIGFVLKLLQLKNYKVRIDFCVDYQEKFIDLINTYTSSYRVDNALYNELTGKAVRMQRELGPDGLIDMIDNLKGIKVSNYQALLNFLPEIRDFSFWQDNSVMQQRFMSSAQTCDDMFTRHVGQLNDLWEQERRHLFNPFSCFADGIRWILWLPSNILLWCGFITEATGRKLQYNWLVKALTFIITIIGLVSSIVTIIIGWEQFYGMITGWIGK